MNDIAIEGTRRRRGWKQDPKGVRRNILEIATELFSEHGMAGARIDEIAARTKTSKRMIYYYFGSKEELWSEALATAYAKVRHGEDQLNLDSSAPIGALAELVGFTFDHHSANPEFIRMVMIENIHRAAFLSQANILRRLNHSAVDKLRDILVRGEEEGVFRRGIDPVALHWEISAMTFFNVANQSTFSSLFGPDLFTPDGQEKLRQQVVDTVLCYVSAKSGATR